MTVKEMSFMCVKTIITVIDAFQNFSRYFLGRSTLVKALEVTNCYSHRDAHSPSHRINIRHNFPEKKISLSTSNLETYVGSAQNHTWSSPACPLYAVIASCSDSL
jgi:hypothetical protein